MRKLIHSFTKILSVILAISILFSAFLVCGTTTVNADTFEDDISYYQFSYMNDQEAKAFIGFLLNTNDVDKYTNTDIYRYLTGTYRNNNDKENEVKLAFSYISQVLLQARMSSSHSEMVTITSDINSYLEKRYVKDSEVAQDEINEALGSIKDSILNILSVVTDTDMVEINAVVESYHLGKDVFEFIQDPQKKIQSCYEEIEFVLNSFMFSSSVQRAEMYETFALYLQNAEFYLNFGDNDISNAIIYLTSSAHALYNEKANWAFVIEEAIKTVDIVGFFKNYWLDWNTDSRIALLKKWAGFIAYTRHSVTESVTSDFTTYKLESKTIVTDTGQTIEYRTREYMYKYDLLSTICSNDIEYTVQNDAITITKYTAQKGKYNSIAIPKTIDGMPITVIADNAFIYQDFKRIVIPDTVKTIGSKAFYGNPGLDDIVILSDDIFVSPDAFDWILEIEQMTMERKDFETNIYCKNTSNIINFINQYGFTKKSLVWNSQDVWGVASQNNSFYINTSFELNYILKLIELGNNLEEFTLDFANDVYINSTNFNTLSNLLNKYKGKLSCEENQIVIEGDVRLGSVFSIPSDVNLLVNGNLSTSATGNGLTIQHGACVTVNNNLRVTNDSGWFCPVIKVFGQLIVKGNADFSSMNEKNAWGCLTLTHPPASFIVYGTINKLNVNAGIINDGTLVFYGDVECYGQMTDNATVHLKGNRAQTIKQLDISNLVLDNTSEDGILFENNIYVRKTITNHSSKTVNGKKIFLSGNVINDYVGDISIDNSNSLTGNVNITGDVDFVGYSTIMSNTTLNIHGNVSAGAMGECLTIQEGANLIIDKNLRVTNDSGWYRPIVKIDGSLIVKGHADFSSINEKNSWGSITMTNPHALFTVCGNLNKLSIGDNQVNNGTLNFYGDVECYGQMTGKATVHLKGNKVQTIKQLDISNLVLENSSEDGIIFENNIYVRKTITNYSSKTVNGKKIFLSGNVINDYVGDISIDNSNSLTGSVNITGDVDFVGYSTIMSNTTLNIHGNVSAGAMGECLTIQEGANLIIDKNLRVTNDSGWYRPIVKIDGSLIVKGHADFSSINEKNSWGGITMTNPHALFSVCGNLNKLSVGDNQVNNGTLNFYGDVSIGGTIEKDAKLNFCGSQNQKIDIEKTDVKYMLIDNSSEEGIIFLHPITVSVLFNHQGNPFTLYNNGNGSSFVDYDGDGMKDNVDPNPVVGNPCTLYFSPNDNEFGSVSETLIETRGGTQINVTATPQSKYYFSKWIDQNGNTVSTNSRYEFIAKTDNHYTAVFEKRKRNITWDCGNGWISTPYEAPIESEVTVTCYPYDGYVFEEGSLKYNDIPIENGTFIMPDEDVFLTATFIRNENYFRLLDKLQEAWQYDSTYYTTDSFNALVNTISAAQNALVNDISEETSTAQINLINQAIDGLKERSIVSLSANNSVPSIYWNCPDMLNSETFTLTYDNNTSETVGIADCEKSAFDVSQLGLYTVTVTYKGVSTEISVNVIPRPLENCTVNPISSQEYQRTACEPELTITYNGDTLVKDVDYTVTYRENINAGTAYADIIGIGNYAGNQTSPFTIQPLYLYEEMVSTNVLEYQFYNRDTLIPDVTISYNGIDLIRGKDYEVDCYSDEYYGFADVYAYGIGNYSGWLHIDMRGDIDRDGCVSGRDLVLLQTYLNSTIEERESLWMSVGAADINADGKVNEADIEALREFLKSHRVPGDILPEETGNNYGIRTITVSSEGTTVGNIISVPINIENNSGFSYLRLNYTYDESKIRFVDIENGNVSDTLFSNDKSIVFWNTENDAIENGKLITLRFKVIDEADNYEIWYKCSECFNRNRSYIDPELSGEAISIKKVGDTNLDGNVNINDVTLIQRYLAELENLPVEQRLLSDTNGDGSVTIDDATHLQNYLAEYDVKLG